MCRSEASENIPILYAAHVLGDVGEVSESDIEEDDYYQPGDYIGKLGTGEALRKGASRRKGCEDSVRDARGRIQGSYQNGKTSTSDL